MPRLRLQGSQLKAEILTALAQLEAWQAARETAKSYAEEIKRRRQDTESVARWRRDAARAAQIESMFGANAARDREALRSKIIQGNKTVVLRH